MPGVAPGNARSAWAGGGQFAAIRWPGADRLRLKPCLRSSFPAGWAIARPATSPLGTTPRAQPAAEAARRDRGDAQSFQREMWEAKWLEDRLPRRYSSADVIRRRASPVGTLRDRNGSRLH